MPPSKLLIADCKDWFRLDGIWYNPSQIDMTYDEAKADCEDRGQRLALISSQQQLDELAKRLGWFAPDFRINLNVLFVSEWKQAWSLWVDKEGPLAKAEMAKAPLPAKKDVNSCDSNAFLDNKANYGIRFPEKIQCEKKKQAYLCEASSHPCAP